TSPQSKPHRFPYTTLFRSVPRNKRHLNQEEKKREILNAASALFAENGFDGTSMTAIARSAGITPNTIYWYFPGKDDVLIGVLNNLTTGVLAEMATMTALPIRERLLNAITIFERPESLMNTVHSRITQSEVIAAWHSRFHMLIEQILVYEIIKAGIAKERAGTLARLLVYIIEGLLSHPLQQNDRENMVDAMLELANMPA